MKLFSTCFSIAIFLAACSTSKPPQVRPVISDSHQTARIEGTNTNVPPSPSKLQAPLNSEKCFENLRLIWGVKESWALEFKKPDDAIPKEIDLFGPENLKSLREITGKDVQKPVCPEGGVYKLDRVDQYPSCSIHGRPTHWP
jgi:hypothetical protein